jgi:high-affinity iron transporter
VGFAFLIMLREGLEIALVVAIILAYLKRLERKEHFKAVWTGAGVGIAAALIAGTIVFVAVGDLHGSAEPITEGAIAFFAAIVLSWMIFWMARQARFIKGSLEAKVDQALEAGSFFSLATIAFVAVIREGMEAALFMLSSTVGQSDAQAAIGGSIGIVIAAGIGYLVYVGSKRINLRLFFRITGLLVVLFAAGLLATGIHEFQAVGIFSTVHARVWDLSGVGLLNPETSTFGGFLHGFFGWSAAPSLEMLLAYFAYLLPVGAAFLYTTRKVPAKGPSHAAERTRAEAA